MNTAAAHISTNLLTLQTVLKLGSYKMAWHRCFDLIAQADRIGIFLIPGMEESIDMDRLDSTNNRQPSDMSLGSLPHGICQNRQLAEGMLARPYHRIDSWRRECWPTHITESMVFIWEFSGLWQLERSMGEHRGHTSENTGPNPGHGKLLLWVLALETKTSHCAVCCAWSWWVTTAYK